MDDLRRLLAGAAVEVAPRLLGARLVHSRPDGTVVVRLTEVEAYAGETDPGSHGYRGRTPRTEAMFGPPGHLYVYFTYGMHWCANVVCGPDGECSAVLLRGGEIVEGIEVARGRRRRPDGASPRDVDLARGPARLTKALGLDGRHDGADLCSAGQLRLEPAPARIRQDGPCTGPRVGVSGPGGDAQRFPWRFWLDGEPTVSPYRPAVARRRRTADG